MKAFALAAALCSALIAMPAPASATLACEAAPPRCSGDFNPGVPTHRHRCAYRGVLTKPTEQDNAPVRTCDNYGCYGNCTATSYAQCRDLCLSSSRECKSFGYDVLSGDCTTSRKIPQEQGYVHSNASTTYFTNADCFVNATYYEGSGDYYFDGLGGSGARANASELVYTNGESEPGPPLQPVFSRLLNFKQTDACQAAEACVVLVDRNYGTNAELNVEYIISSKRWLCQAWTSELTLIDIQYTPDSTVGEYYSFSTGFQR